ncbi:NUO18 [Auxenochlorella protothecoides x Auxenochlorella symbiontica]
MARRGGGGGPLSRAAVPTQPLAEQDELIWQDGTGNPETALDSYDLVTPGQALGWLAAGMGVFAAVGAALSLDPPEKRVPWARKDVLVPPEIEKTFSR